jgi:hypothetical protein
MRNIGCVALLLPWVGKGQALALQACFSRAFIWGALWVLLFPHKHDCEEIRPIGINIQQ